jgi:hypothetical protein
MAEVPKQSKNKNPDAPIRSDGNVSNLPVSASAPKMPTARKLKKNHAAPIGTPDSAAFYLQTAISSEIQSKFKLRRY